jgi:hypothetical protein
MSARTSAELIEGYITRLKAELTFLGAAEAADLVAEIRSLLVDAAGDDPERAAAEIEKIGEPAQLAAGILAEKGLSPADGMSTAEWWRMGIAVPIDIAIGLSVPLAAAFPLSVIAAEIARGNGVPAGPLPYAMVAFFLGALVWPWYVWGPWRTGGPRATAGMAITGLTVVRAPGFRRVVRSRDLAALGMRPPRRSRLSGLVALAVAGILLILLGSVAGAPWSSPTAAFEDVAGSREAQRQSVVDTVDQMYDSLVRLGTDVLGERYVQDPALSSYELLIRRAKEEQISAYEIGEPTRLSPCAWKVPVTEKTARGTHKVTFVLTLRVVISPGDENRVGWTPDWVIYEIAGEGLTPTP